MVSKLLKYLLPVLAVLSCSREGKDIAGADAVEKQVMIAPDSKATVPAYDGSNFATIRTILLNQDFPWSEIEAEGTYCNIYKYPVSATGAKWYHPIKTDREGNPLTDGGAAITGWSGTPGNYLAQPGDIPEYSYTASPAPADTWGDSSNALWAKDILDLLAGGNPGISFQNYYLYRLLAVSPAKDTTCFRSNGQLRTGIKLARTDDVLISDAQQVVLRGTYLADRGSTDNLYVYGLDGDTPDLPLYDTRSKLSVFIYVDEALGEVNVNKITLGNYITDAVYMPVDEVTGKSRWIFDWDGNSHLFLNSSNLPQDEYGSTACYNDVMPTLLKYRNSNGDVNPPLEVISNFYIFSEDYSELDDKGLPVHPLPTVKVFLGADDDIVSVSIPLSWNFLPQHHYRFTVRVARWYISIFMQGDNWDSAEQSDYTFGAEPVQTIYLDSPLVGGNVWEPGNGAGETGTI